MQTLTKVASVRFSFRRVMSVISGATGIFSAILWHQSSGCQLKAAAISHALSVSPDTALARISSYPDLINISPASATKLMDGLNNLALIQNNLAAAFAIAASMCIAAALFSER
ncbi:hypothetical protein [Herbaspirillum robiniae]|uniref:hypothetical protein n=1 Tax=Herbaspirillum robiniae TaxID=2014887 RepID=UPI00101AD138|nr:hypothetical protein [Herbaspirillum robiniae]